MQSSMRAVWRKAMTAGTCAAAVMLAACGGGSGSDDGNGGGDGGASDVPASTLRVHYQRTSDAAYADWAVYSWSGPATASEGWPGTPRYSFTQVDGFGGYVDIALDTSKSGMDFLLNNAADPDNILKDCDDRSVAFAADIAERGQQVWLKEGDCGVYDSADAAGGGGIAAARAMWLSRDTLVWPGASGGSHVLYHAAEGGMALTADGAITGADGSVELSTATLSDALKQKFPHLASAPALRLPAGSAGEVPDLLKGQLLVARMVDGKVAEATQLQIQGVLDDVYASAAVEQDLGVSFAGDGTPTFRLWAPTARTVLLNIKGKTTREMTLDAASGVWSATGDKSWTNADYYTYSVEVYSRRHNAVRTHEVTDPYAVTLNANGEAAMVADLRAAAFKPAGWDGHTVPGLEAPEDVVLYELHVRDFSATDESVPAAQRGKYLAFTQEASAGMTHLRRLAQAGLTHVHLLPVYDINTVDETGCVNPSVNFDGPAGTGAQASIEAVKDQDCFNWGYDPRHYGAPEGSYASDAADGVVRVREFRAMVKSLHEAGLRVVMDVVYNHTSGDFLDRIVPGYYYRLSGDGNIETSTCCENTAPEYAMMEKLMTDTLKVWAREYKVDGFRFDLMGHIPKGSMLRARAAVDAAAGRELYYYGEGWDFGEVAGDRQFVQARQPNMAGTGIGTFTDRLRDAVRGGGPFDTGEDIVRNQGFVNGLCHGNNELNAGACTNAQRQKLHAEQNWIRIGMAGSIRDFTLNGQPASQYRYGDQPVGYVDDPQEIINYVGAHDNETLFDISQLKHPRSLNAADRARAQVVALSTILLAQGVPFIHAGDELLRTKSFDRDSYNSGDWFNRVDWTAQTNFYGEMGLPPAEKNQGNWDLLRQYLNESALATMKPAAQHIEAAREATLDLLRVRRDTRMFRLRTGDDVKSCVSFPDEAAQRDGLIVMRIAGSKAGGGSCGDGKYASVVVLVNGSADAQQFVAGDYAGRTLALHSEQLTGSDAVARTASYTAASGTFSVPARTAVVFVEAN